MWEAEIVGVCSFPGHSESMLFFMALGISVLYSNTQNSYLCICWSWFDFLELMHSYNYKPSPLKALGLREALENESCIHTPCVRGINPPNCNFRRTGMSTGVFLLSDCSWKAFRYRKAGVLRGSFTEKGGVRHTKKCFLWSSAGPWTGYNYWAGYAQVKFVVTDGAGGGVRLSMPHLWWVRPLLDLLIIPLVIHWAVMAASVVQCQETFCGKLLSTYKYLA